MNSRQKGHQGHVYTEKYLQAEGWSTYTCPHATINWANGGGKSGWKDAFAAPNPETGKLEGGFDIIAAKPVMVRLIASDTISRVSSATYWQVKKTKANPITKRLKAETINCADYHKLPRESCYVIWWPNGHGPKGKPPVIWRADVNTIK